MLFIRAFLAVILTFIVCANAGAQIPTNNSQDQQPASSSSAGEKQGGSQDAAGSSAQAATPQAQQPREKSEKELQKQEQSQRILGVVPQFGITSRQNAPPLTTGEKFHLAVKSSLDPFSFAVAGFEAGLGQATDEFPGYGQGAAGYGKRYGASYADSTSSNFFSNFIYPSLLKEDPRYFRLGQGSIKHRILYSLEQEFVCHTDRGGRSFNWSNVLGAFSSGGLSNVYYPRSDRGFGLTVSRSSIALLYGSVGGLVDEFWIDIHDKVFHKRADKH